jgi:hypothetical protein
MMRRTFAKWLSIANAKCAWSEYDAVHWFFVNSSYHNILQSKILYENGALLTGLKSKSVKLKLHLPL